MSWVSGPVPIARPVPPSARTAKTLILVALIFEGIAAAIFVAAGAAFLFYGFGVFFLAGGVIAFLILWLVYEFTYKRVAQGNYEGARTPTLIWTIILFLTLSLISAILFLIAYIKLGDAIREAPQPPYGGGYGPGPYGASAYGAPASPPPTYPLGAGPGYGGAAYGASPAPAGSSAGSSPVCPRCGRPASYIPQYGRWYCYLDQQYL